jgi:hypothetical protein
LRVDVNIYFRKNETVNYSVVLPVVSLYDKIRLQSTKDRCKVPAMNKDNVFKKYLDRIGLHPYEFARLKQLPMVTLYRVYNGHRPSAKKAMEIQKATKGEVQAIDLLYG